MSDTGVVPMTWFDGEPSVGPWRPVDIAELARELLGRTADAGRPAVVAVDERSAGGKTGVADRLHQVIRRSCVVHTDDLAWHHSYFSWQDLLIEQVLRPARTGVEVCYRPEAWQQRGRPGAVHVPAGSRLVLVEGVGAGRHELSELLDAVVWVASDRDEARRRGIARDIDSGVNGNREQAVAFWDEWEAEGVPFLAAQRPWERADVVVAGTRTVPLRPGKVAVVLPVPVLDLG